MWPQKVKSHSHVFDQSEGYDYDFVEEPQDSLKCLICLLVVREPQQHGDCGKLFCKSCIRRYQADKNDCPHCRQPLSDYLGHTTIFNDFKSAQEVKSLTVLCKHRCGWTGELRSVDSHLEKDCEKSLVKCPNDCGNGNIAIVRKNLASHLQSKCPNRQHTCPECEAKMRFLSYNNHLLKECPKRQYRCPYCKETGSYDERTTTHLETCTKVIIKCTKCSCEILRIDMPRHPLVCLYEPVRCQYHIIGCRERPLRKDQHEHELDTQSHLLLAMQEVLRLRNVKHSLTFKIRGFNQYRVNKSSFHSPCFTTSGDGYKLYVWVDANGNGDSEGTHVSVFACLMKGDNDDFLSWPFTGTVTFELLNQLEDKNHHKMIMTFPADHEASQRVVDGEKAQTGWGWSNFISHAELKHNPLINRQYLKDDTLVFRVSAEAPNYKPWLESTN